MLSTKRFFKEGFMMRRVYVLAGFSVLLAGCASDPLAPTDSVQLAEQAINKAEDERAVEYAALEMRSAREKLTLAREAVQKRTDEDTQRAERLAQEARADAEYAQAKAELAKAQAVNNELKRGVQTLEQELDRSTGGSK
jgi:hypothetical protein